MKARTMITIAAGLLVLSGALAGACKNGGGGGQLTIDEYIQQIVSTDQAHEARANPFRSQLDQAFAGLSDSAPVPAEAVTAFGGLIDEEEKFLGEVSDIDPPEEAADLHQEAIDSLQEDHDLLAQTVSQINETTTFAQLQQLFESEDLAQAETRRTDACLAIQQFASDNGVEVDLTC